MIHSKVIWIFQQDLSEYSKIKNKPLSLYLFHLEYSDLCTINISENILIHSSESKSMFFFGSKIKKKKIRSSNTASQCRKTLRDPLSKNINTIL